MIAWTTFKFVAELFFNHGRQIGITDDFEESSELSGTGSFNRISAMSLRL